MATETTDNAFQPPIDLNEDIASLSIFSCAKCNGFLVPPIRLADGVGHVCGDCDLLSTVATHDLALELIFEKLTIFCPNRSKGCSKKFKYNDASSHLAVCFYRPYPCPFAALNGCSWNGQISHIFRHVIKKHPGNNMDARHGDFRLTVDVSTHEDTIKILEMGSEQFVAHVKQNSANKLHYVIYHVKRNEKEQVYYYSPKKVVKFGDNWSVQNDKKYEVLNYENFNPIAINDAVFTIDFDLVQKQTQPPAIETVIQINKENTEEDVDDIKLRNVLECSICLNLMRPPISLCLTGHSLCEDCKKKLQRCPTCKANFGNARNYTLESLCVHVRFPCRYKETGCNVVMLLPNITEHEAKCEAMPFRCPFSKSANCSWTGVYSNLETHLRKLHNDKSTFSSSITYSLRDHDVVKGNLVYSIIMNKDVFRVCVSYNQNTRTVFFAVHYAGPQSKVKDFMYQFILFDSLNPKRQVICSDVCQKINYEKELDQCLQLGVATFTSTANLKFCCKINDV